MADALAQLAMFEAVRLSAEIEVQLTHRKLKPDRKAELSPLLAALVKMRRKAAGAIAELAFTPAENPVKIRDLQNDVKVFVEFCEALKEIVDAGIDATEAIDGDEVTRAEIEDAQSVVLPPDQIELLQDMGLSPRRQRRTED